MSKSESLMQKIKKHIDENYHEKSLEIFIDSDYELDDNTKAAILAAQTKNEVLAVVDGKFYDIFNDEEFDKIEQIIDELANNEPFDEQWSDLSEDQIDELREYIREKGIVYLDYRSLLGEEVDANIFPLNDPASEDYDFYNFENLLDINRYTGATHILGAMPKYSENLLKIMEMLQINPYEVGELLKSRGDIEINTFPNIEYENKNINTPVKFLEELENAADGNSFMITVKLNLWDYVNNFEKYQERGITIPAGACCGMINTVQGSCSFVGYLQILKEMPLKTYHLYLEDKMPGYGLDEIAGVVRSAYWNQSLSFSKTEQELKIIEACETFRSAIGPVDRLGYKQNTDVKAKVLDSVASKIAYSIQAGGLSNNLFSNCLDEVANYYWVKDKEEEFILDTMLDSRELLGYIEKGDAQSASAFAIKTKYSNEDFVSPLQAKIKYWAERIPKVDLYNQIVAFLKSTKEDGNSQEQIDLEANKVKNMFLEEFKTSEHFDKDYRICRANGEKFDGHVNEIRDLAEDMEKAIKEKDSSLFLTKFNKVNDIITNELSRLLEATGYDSGEILSSDEIVSSKIAALTTDNVVVEKI